MTESFENTNRPVLLLVAGAKGAIGTTLAAATTAGESSATVPWIAPYLTTTPWRGFPGSGRPDGFRMAGWDLADGTLGEAMARHGVLPESVRRQVTASAEAGVVIRRPPTTGLLTDRIDRLAEEMAEDCDRYPEASPVFINLLPAANGGDLGDCADEAEVTRRADPDRFPDIAYVLAAIRAGVPVVNFTPNAVDVPAVTSAAASAGVPIAGRDGKTGQTYFKVVIASALKARGLRVDGWYSLNILGNADGANLRDPACAREKLDNKTRLLDDILGYRVGEGYDAPTHQVRIDYYPPRGDAKEAWDVIDFTGLFGLPMSLRVNLQGRDSILAAPMILDLARWMALLKRSGRSGPVPELGFFFKKPVGPQPPVTFADQIRSLDRLKTDCMKGPETSR